MGCEAVASDQRAGKDVFRPPLLLACAMLLLLVGCTSGPEPAATGTAEPWFEDVTTGAGVAFTHIRAPVVRHWFPEIMSGGGCWLDYDGDGDLDLFLVQGGDPDPAATTPTGHRLFRNRGDGTFEEVTPAAGVAGRGYGNGCAVGDYDGDGDRDLLVTALGPDLLYRNDGDGAFTEVAAAAGVAHPGWGTSAAFADYDTDGHLDLFVVNYVDWAPEREIECFAGGNERDYCLPANYSAPVAAVLYHNDGDGTFTDMTDAAGISRMQGNGLGVTAGDFNGDGRLDFYVTNDGNPNALWVNQGDGTFTEQALAAGVAVDRQGVAEAGMGVTAVDMENDGDLDLFVSNLRGETNTLYRNQGGVFEDATIPAGLAMPSLPYTGFGLGFADFDHDGHLDLYVANGRVGKTLAPLGDDPYGEPNQLYQGLGNGQFEERLPQGGLATPLIETSRAAALADYDQDGDIDVLVVNNGGVARLLRNRVGAERGRWIMFRVLDQQGRDAIGAKVRITTANGVQWRPVQTAYSYQASHDPRVHFGLGTATAVTDVQVVWPDGSTTSFGPRPAGQVHTLSR
jgi:hypothetical protein